MALKNSLKALLKKQYKLVLDSRTEKYGGTHAVRDTLMAEEGECDGQPFHLAYDLPAYGVAVFRF